MMFNAQVKILDRKMVTEEFKKIKVAREGIDIMMPKTSFFIIKLQSVPIKDAIILKQESLSCGCDAALAWNIVSLKTEATDALIFGSGKELEILIAKMRKQPFNGKKIAEEIEKAMLNFQKNEYVIKTRTMKLNAPPKKIMGILNVTPDSFYDGGKYFDIERAVMRAQEIEKEGADIIDIGAESTRPYSEPLPLEEELSRIMPVLEAVKDKVRIPVSVDTYKWQVADKALENGAEIINDIYGLTDEKMIKVIREYGAGAVIMHMKDTPKTMQDNAEYKDPISEIYGFLNQRANNAVLNGIDPEKIIVDPGIGFGKKVAHNLAIINRLQDFRSLGYPILIGTSRKGFIGKITGEALENRMLGSLTTILIALQNGASIIRVHDVKETKEVLKVYESVIGENDEES